MQKEQNRSRSQQGLKWIGILLLLMTAWILVDQLLRSSRGSNVEESKFPGAESGIDPSSRLRDQPKLVAEGVGVVRSNRFASTGRLDSAAILDGEWILSVPVSEHQLTMQALTNSGILPDLAKGLLRPILGHLYSVSAYNGLIRGADRDEAEEMDRIRNDESRGEDERSGVLKVTAAAYRQSRELWVGRRDKRLGEFNAFVNRLNVSSPDELLRELLLIQPQSPPPDPHRNRRTTD